jgi:hypothetical protein
VQLGGIDTARTLSHLETTYADTATSLRATRRRSSRRITSVHEVSVVSVFLAVDPLPEISPTSHAGTPATGTPAPTHGRLKHGLVGRTIEESLQDFAGVAGADEVLLLLGGADRLMQSRFRFRRPVGEPENLCLAHQCVPVEVE